MGFWDGVARFLSPDPVVQERDASSLEDFAQRILGTRTGAWTPATVTQALSVPAIYAAVSLISNSIGSLTLRGFRNGVLMDDADRPRIIIRPNPFTTPREFFRDTAYSMATRGEAWWWIAKRDIDDSPLSVLPINPVEVMVTENDRNPLRPVIEWRGTQMPNDDMVQITLQREPWALRGTGPLQRCGAAISVGVEAQEFAANFYGDGGYPSVVIKKAGQLDPTLRDEFWVPDTAGLSEADRLRAQWLSKPNNVPRVIDDGIESITEHEPDVARVQMLDGRARTDLEVATMFNMSAAMLNAAVQGGSLLYQNIAMKWEDFVRGCLRPNYLEPIEQAMSDLLTRSTVSRFNTDALIQDNLAARADFYAKVVPLGVVTVDEARSQLGLAPGDIENAPVPLAVPQAIPDSLPIQQRTMRDVRCPSCGHLYARSDGRVEGRCRNCKMDFIAA